MADADANQGPKEFALEKHVEYILGLEEVNSCTARKNIGINALIVQSKKDDLSYYVTEHLRASGMIHCAAPIASRSKREGSTHRPFKF